MQSTQHSIPTNIIMGFLGSGKTTRIQGLLDHKDQRETWGVLVNEFGEVGIDGKTLSGAVVKEVAGGCMCCTAGLPAKMALALLIRQARPRRIIIEPTGLGHPTRLLAMLQEEHYHDVIQLQSILCLVDPRRLEDTRYTQNTLFRDQARVADVLLATKVDLCTPQQIEKFYQYANSFTPAKAYVGLSGHHTSPDEYLYFQHNQERLAREPEHHEEPRNLSNRSLPLRSAVHSHNRADGDRANDDQTVTLNAHEWLRKDGVSRGFHNCGWRFGADFVFGEDEFGHFLRSSGALRAKAIVNCSNGRLIFNYSDGQLEVRTVTEQHHDDHANESLVELIYEDKLASDEREGASSTRDWSAVESRLLACASTPVKSCTQEE